MAFQLGRREFLTRLGGAAVALPFLPRALASLGGESSAPKEFAEFCHLGDSFHCE